ncbi:Type I restriction-modification system methyltransferase subunit [Metamycoplasma cloacale]|nr:Type I restriction-modification system methyltransferase subunit [Metamycoplasma cloacale]
MLLSKFANYDMNKYFEDIDSKGLKTTWIDICNYLRNVDFSHIPEFFNFDNIHEVYEIGLARVDKTSKKKMGQYYTPKDVAKLMSQWFLELNGENICDVACGTGRLILEYLELLNYNEAKKMINDKKIYLYDLDETAMLICKTLISIKYGKESFANINTTCGDFLNEKIKLPHNSKVISNPPYAKIDTPLVSWKKTDISLKSKELYAIFIEKIIEESNAAVIISPFSFLSSNKFYLLREKMSLLGGGFVISFDNVPGTIFAGKKYGIFNSNKGNSVRAAITVFNKQETLGFKISPLIRFKTEQREEILKDSVLRATLPKYRQIINKHNDKFKKIDSKLLDLYNCWVSKSKFNINDFVLSNESQLFLDIPKTCRYYTTASSKKLNRANSFTLFFDNESVYDFCYCLINSSFAYWWWRIFEGAINLSSNTLKSIPLPINLLSLEDKKFFQKIRKEMTDIESHHIIKKNNCNMMQENIKFPDKYRNIINERILNILGLEMKTDELIEIHNNYFKI